MFLASSNIIYTLYKLYIYFFLFTFKLYFLVARVDLRMLRMLNTERDDAKNVVKKNYARRVDVVFESFPLINIIDIEAP